MSRGISQNRTISSNYGNGHYSSVLDPHFEADPDPTYHFNADPDPTYHYHKDPDADPDPDLY
jgi:hypothetical protein